MKIIQIIKLDPQLIAESSGNEDEPICYLAGLGDDGRIYVGQFYLPEGNAPWEWNFQWTDKLANVPEKLQRSA